MYSRIALLTLVGAFAVLLASCASVPSQLAMQDFPYQIAKPAQTAAIDAPGTSSNNTQNAAFPDFYLLIDQDASTILWTSLLEQLPILLGADGQDLPALDPRFSGNIKRLVLFRPEGAAEKRQLQGMLFGLLPRGIVQSALANSASWKQTTLQTDSSGTLSVFAKGNFQLAPINDAGIAFAIGSDAESFRAATLRADAFSRGLLAPSGAPEGSFQAVLNSQNTNGDAFLLLSIAMDSQLPAAALRVQLQPNGTEATSPVDLRMTVLTRPDLSIKALKTGLKLLLVGLSGAAGLGEDFLSSLQFTEQENQLRLDGFKLNQAEAARLISSFVAFSLASSTLNEGANQP